MTVRQWLQDTQEPIEAITFGLTEYEDHPSQEVLALCGRLLTIEEAAPLLDEEFDESFGAFQGRPCYAWTATRVYFVHAYDGSIRLRSVPRHPASPGACDPQNVGY